MLSYTSINKNSLVPKVTNCDSSIENAIKILVEWTNGKDNLYCSNTYIACSEDNIIRFIIFSNSEGSLYKLTNDGIFPFRIVENPFNEELLGNICSFLNNETPKIVDTPKIVESNISNVNAINESIELTPVLKTEEEPITPNNSPVESKTEEEIEKINVLDECEKMMRIFEENNRRKKVVEAELRAEEKEN